MDPSQPSTNWRQMFERGREQRPAEQSRQQSTHRGFDDGPADRATPMSPGEVADAAAMALAVDPQDYHPWALQRGTRPVLMLHLRRFELRSGLWSGWQVAYPHLVAVEYTGDTMLSLDFGARQFVIMGRALGELVAHLQNGNVLTITEFCSQVWRTPPAGSCVTSIKLLGQGALP